MAVAAVSRAFTVEEYERMAEAGVFGPEERVELIDGEVVQMSPIGGRHARCVNQLTTIFAPVAGAKRAIMQVQGPLLLAPASMPEPDLLVLAWRDDFYPDRARTADVLLAIEVADSSLHFDRSVKVPLYGRMGLRETWLVDLVGGQVDVNRRPGADGYASTTRHYAGESIAAEALPDLAVDLAPLLS